MEIKRVFIFLKQSWILYKLFFDYIEKYALFSIIITYVYYKYIIIHMWTLSVACDQMPIRNKKVTY
jgi:hypothetical protein